LHFSFFFAASTKAFGSSLAGGWESSITHTLAGSSGTELGITTSETFA